MLPSPLTLLAVVVVIFLGVLAVVRGPVDADYWWHLATGRLILEHGAVPTTDPFSFAYDGPWLAHEWLGEVIIFALVSTLGYSITAALFGLAAAASLMIPAFALQRHGVAARALVPFGAVAAYSLASFATVRPQVLSWLLLGALLALLMSLRSQHRFRPWLVVPLFVLWANVHGLYVIGLGVLLIWAAFTGLGRTRFAPRWRSGIAMVVASSLAAAFTPAGPFGLVYPLRYLRQDDWGTSFIAEWQMADFTDPRQWGLVLLIAATLGLARGRAPGWLATIGVVGLIAGFVAVRNQPLTAIMALPLLATELHARLGVAPPRRNARQRRLLEIGLAAVVISVMLVVLPRVAGGSVERAYPTTALDVLVEENPSARTLADYDWGGYAIQRLHPTGGSVFVDGRSDMYPREVFEDYLTLRAAEAGWQELLRHYGVEAILLPPDAPLVAAASDEGWCDSFRGEKAVMLRPCEG